MTEEKNSYEGWAILELMGHRQLGGYLRQAELAGAPFLRIDLYGDNEQPIMTQLYAPNSVYCITPTEEREARAVGMRFISPPVQRWQLQTTLEPVEAQPITEQQKREPEIGDDEDPF